MLEKPPKTPTSSWGTRMGGWRCMRRSPQLRPVWSSTRWVPRTVLSVLLIYSYLFISTFFNISLLIIIFNYFIEYYFKLKNKSYLFFNSCKMTLANGMRSQRVLKLKSNMAMRFINHLKQFERRLTMNRQCLKESVLWLEVGRFNEVNEVEVVCLTYSGRFGGGGVGRRLVEWVGSWMGEWVGSWMGSERVSF